MSAGEAGGKVPRAPRTPNTALRAIRRERGETLAEFAEAMERIARETGKNVKPDEKYVQRLEAGVISWPNGAYREILVRLCGRPAIELGFTPPMLYGSGTARSEANYPEQANIRLRDAVWASGMELSDFAGKVGVTPKTAERWITQGRIPQPRHRWKSAQILKCEESELWPNYVFGFGLAPKKSHSASAGISNNQFLINSDVISDSLGFAPPIKPAPAQLTIASPAHLQEILIHLSNQWHALVKTDNLLGPRFALSDVLNQISVIEALCSVLRDKQRIEVARLGAKYAESAAWLYEEAGYMMQARFWTSQAMEWAYEGDDERMLAWTIFRRAQQAAAVPDASQTIGLAQAARRNEEKLATPTRAAIRAQEAYGYALDGNEKAAQRLLDEAHNWAANDTVGDAHEGHGSYCTADFIEIQRGHCWLASGQPKKAISVYEDSLRTLPTVYQRNRTATLTRLAAAYAADSQPEQAANTAYAALPVARSAGSGRIVGEIKHVGTALIPYRALPAVAVLLDELEAEDQ
jgi:transcriptional regulator with XRE-family HTH domain